MFSIPRDCPLCPRLVGFREANALKFPAFFNGAVSSFGGLDAALLVVGLAPGLKGANATGRPFTGDFAGDILYGALLRHGLARGMFLKRPDDGLELVNVRVANAVRCVPPENKPQPDEIRRCNPYLMDEIGRMEKLKVILTLGNISHAAVLRAFGQTLSSAKFGHAAEHGVSKNGRSFIMLNSYHTSRYNIQTRRLTEPMFDKIIARAKALIEG